MDYEMEGGGTTSNKSKNTNHVTWEKTDGSPDKKEKSKFDFPQTNSTAPGQIPMGGQVGNEKQTTMEFMKQAILNLNNRVHQVEDKIKRVDNVLK